MNSFSELLQHLLLQLENLLSNDCLEFRDHSIKCETINGSGIHQLYGTHYKQFAKKNMINRAVTDCQIKAETKKADFSNPPQKR